MAARTRSGLRLSDGTPLKELVRVEEGRIAARVFTDPEIYQLELERIFLRCWLAVAHESEIPHPGDYVTRRMGEDPVIVVRDRAGQIHVLLNSCTHRGAEICRASRGNTREFVCPYHGYRFHLDGELASAPAHEWAYDQRFDRKAFTLHRARVGTYGGLIFATWDASAPPLEEYLGDMRWYLDLLLRRTAGGVEVVGAPHRWIIEANWKTGADNFIGDGLHTFMTHRYAIELGVLPNDPLIGWFGWHISIGRGHGVAMVGAPERIPLPPYLGLPQELWPLLERALTDVQRRVLERTATIHGTVFPNLSLLNTTTITTEEGVPRVPFLTLRVWIPLGPHRMEILSWFLVEKEGPEWYKEASRKNYERTFGLTGTFEEDDADIWVSLTRANRGAFARKYHVFNYEMGLHRQPRPKAEWPGPGDAYWGDYCEANQRTFWAQWRHLMAEDGG
ncbi:3-phenylpropionate/cinnamic acid dioxygenase subunit alpha [bacterium HR10]|nr:3-phenylpropionate/cinnamic acid dioxygenase subunit alpha [bacterium HR10]